MLTYLNTVYKRLWVFGENTKVSLSPSWLTRSQSPLLCVGMDVPKCDHWTLSRSYSSPKEQVLYSFQNVPFCHPWMSARKSNFISISSFSSISSECGLMVWTLIHPLQKMGKKNHSTLSSKIFEHVNFYSVDVYNQGRMIQLWSCTFLWNERTRVPRTLAVIQSSLLWCPGKLKARDVKEFWGQYHFLWWFMGAWDPLLSTPGVAVSQWGRMLGSISNVCCGQSGRE